jgi:mRNA interferase MazF
MLDAEGLHALDPSLVIVQAGHDDGGVPPLIEARQVTRAVDEASVFRPEVVIAGRDTKILIDQIRTIDVSYVAGQLVDYLSPDDMAQVEHSLSRYLGLLR